MNEETKTGAPPEEFPSVQLDAVCDSFEQAWKDGNEPRIEDYLGRVPPRLRQDLLRELVVLDVAYRRRRGSESSMERYRQLDPDLTEEFLGQAGRNAAEWAREGHGPDTQSGGTDVNLGFAMLALRLNLVQKSDLAAAVNDWALDRRRCLADVLLEKNAITQANRELVEDMIRRQGNNGATQPTNDARGPLPQRNQHVAPSESEKHGSLANEDATILETIRRLGGHADSSRYVPLRPHARGGLGEVHVAFDTEVERRVALKEIQLRFADDFASRTRFIQEAHITGQLEHPGVVPVYGLGRYADGRPYYAMRFIRGQSLKEAITEFHSNRKIDEGKRRLEMNRLLERFISVCNTMAYAHNRGIVHRDLKPSNIMLGKYGETIVVDWGLAKSLESLNHPDVSEGPVFVSSKTGSTDTQPGAKLGTPVYMSPEQAAGKTEEIGTHSDVYSLGATLYHLITGQAAFSGDHDTVYNKVGRGEFAAPRTVDRRIDRRLNAICLKAMALNPDDRYLTATELADDIARWLAKEPVHAFAEPLASRAARWCRRHKQVLIPAGTTALVVVLIGAGLEWNRWREADRTRRAAEALLDTARTKYLARDFEEARPPIRDLLARTERFPQLSSIRSQASDIDGKMNRVDEFQSRFARAMISLFEATQFTSFGDRAELDYAKASVNAALGTFGMSVDGKEPIELAASDLDGSPRRSVVARGYLLLAMYAQALKRRMIESESRKDNAFRREAVAVLDRAALLDPALGKTRAHQLLRDSLTEPRGDVADAMRLRVDDVRPAPKLTAEQAFAGHLLTGLFHFDRGEFEKAVGSFRLADSVDREGLGASYLTAMSLIELGHFDEATSYLNASLETSHRLWTLVLRGGALLKAGNTRGAIEAFGEAERAIEESRQSEGSEEKANPRDYRAITYSLYVNRAIAKILDKQLDEATTDLRKAIEIAPRRFEAHLNLAEVLRRQGDLESARAEVDEAIGEAPGSARSYRVRANIRAAAQQYEAALADVVACIRLSPANDAGLADDYLLQGRLLKALDRMGEAIPAWEKGIALRPDSAELLREMGEGLIRLNRPKPAMEAYVKLVQSKDAKPEDYQKLGMMLALEGKSADAFREYTASLQSSKEPSARVLAQRGWLVLNEGAKIAVEDFQKAAALEPNNPNLRAGLAYAHAQLGNVAEARKDIEAALRQDKDNRKPNERAYLRINLACVATRIAERSANAAEAAEARKQALDLLEGGLNHLGDPQGRKSYLEAVVTDASLSSLRATPEFQTWLGGHSADREKP